MKYDSIDLQILNILLRDASTSIQSIGEEVGLSNNPCWRRIKRLQDSGVIKHKTIKLDQQKLGLNTIAFVQIRIDSHEHSWLEKFATCINAMPEIVECHRLAGEVDYLLKIQLRDLRHYDQVYQRLVDEVAGLHDVSASFSMQEIKHDNQLSTPINRKL